jgi:DNA-3-methyladenine glycosylase
MNSKFEFLPDFTKSLQKEFFLGETIDVARELIGKILVKKTDGREILAARIVETEAYLNINDLASHSAPGLTKRNAPMFEEGGILYVYKIYGFHFCINFVTEQKGVGCAVLIRAGEPLSGIEIMEKNRKTDKFENLCKGPGCISQALGFNLSNNYKKLYDKDLYIQNNNDYSSIEIMSSIRVGITKSADLPFRFYLKDSKFVSGKKNGTFFNKKLVN